MATRFTVVRRALAVLLPALRVSTPRIL